MGCLSRLPRSLRLLVIKAWTMPLLLGNVDGDAAKYVAQML